MLTRFCTLFFTVFLSAVLSAQVVTISPSFPTQNDNVTITFNAALGNGELQGVVPVYAHTGVILEGSDGWQNVQGNWATADPNVLMTTLGNNLYQISYNISAFYNLQPGDVVQKLAFVFRNTSGSLVGRNADQSDIFVDIYPDTFSGGIQTPYQPEILFDNPSNFQVSAATNTDATITLYLDNVELSTADNVMSLSASADFTGMPTGQYWLWMEATDGSTTITDSTYVILQGDPDIQESPAGVVDGINYIDDSTVILQIFAPYKNFIYVLGDFNNWEFHPDYFMHKTPAGDRYWVEVPNLNPGQEYRFQYSIDQGDMRVADIYADKILDPYNDPYIPASVYPNLISYPTGKTTEIVSVLQTAQTPYNWQVQNFNRPPSDNLIIYELLIRDFDENHSFQAVTDHLDYLDSLGVNAIELMPFNEFEGNESWGYNPDFYFAPDKYYGTKAALKNLIDQCHLRGIAVIQDVVFNHSFGQNPQLRMYSQSGGPSGPPTANSPYFNVTATHPFSVGYDYNHSAPATQEFMKRNLKYWVQEYKIDGFRFDLSKGFTQNVTTNVGQWGQYDQSRVDNWLRIRDEIHEYDDNVYMILEHLGDNSEETVLANAGLMPWGNLNHEYNEASMGYSSNLNWADYQNRNWQYANLVTYAESHDEERLMYKNLEYGNSNGDYDVTDLATALERQEAIAAFLIPLRGPKMIWQFGELGYDYSLFSCPDGTISENCRTTNKPVRWDYLDVPERQHLFKVYSALSKLKTENEAMRSNNYNWDVSGYGKRLVIQDPSMNVVVIANFNVTSISLVPGFPHTGTWYNYLSGESIIEDNLSNAFLLQPGEYRIYTDVELQTPDLSVGIDEVGKYRSSFTSVYPNPFDALTTVSYQLSGSQHVTLNIFDLNGRLIRHLANGHQAGGNYNISWNGKMDSGERCAPGVYLIQLVSDEGTANTKVVYQGE